MSSPSATHLFVGLAAALLIIWVLVPPLMVALRLIRVHSQPVETPDVVEPTDQDPLYRRLFEQLAALGFQAAGIEYQVGWFLSAWDWRKQFEVRWMMTPDRQTFASLHKLIPEEPWRFGMATLLSDGSVVRTSCPGVEGLNGVEVGYSVARLLGADPAGLFARHREHVDAFCRARGSTVATTTFAEMTAREVALGERLLNATPNAQGALFRTFFLMPALLALAILWLVGDGLRWVDFAHAGGIAAISTRLLRDFVVMPHIRMSILASHSETATAPVPGE